MGLVDSIITLLLAFVLIYVGAVILWSFNPFLAVLFILVALFIAARSIGKGGRGL